MISDAFEVFGQHQGIEALYRIGTIFFYVDNDIILYLIKKLVDDIIGSDDIIRFFPSRRNGGIRRYEADLFPSAG